MPFISEELYQKLPVWPGKIESICIAPYPTGNNFNLNAETVDKELDFAYSVVKTIRSLCSSVNVPNNVKCSVFVSLLPSITNPESYAHLVETEQELIVTLAKSGKVQLIKEGVQLPKGCIMDIAASTAEVHVNVSEHIHAMGSWFD